MLRKFAYNKLFRTTGMLILFILLMLFPMSKKYSLEDEKTIKAVTNIDKKEIYLLDKNGYVSRYKMKLNYTNDKYKFAKYLMELLIIDGKYQDEIPNGFMVILPSDTKINSIDIKNEDISVDLSEDIFDLTKENELKALELITYNLTMIEGINNVYISINNELLTYLPKSNKYITQPLTRKNGINKEVNLNSYKNTNLTTIYYINKNSDYYYIPVSKVNNDKRDKIEIIIDELTTSHIYEKNLMSFLNYNTKLLSYNMEDNVLSLEFNDYLFDDVNTKNVLEEVVYSICLSIRDNYDVNEVVFNVDGKEIIKSTIKNIE